MVTMCAAVAVNIICSLAPWLSPWKCLVESVSAKEWDGGGVSGVSVDSAERDRAAEDLITATAGESAAESAAAAAEVLAAERGTEGAMDIEDLTDATTTFLSSFKSISFPHSYEEWMALFRSTALASKEYAFIIAKFITSANITHAIAVVIFLLIITAKIWTKFVSELLENLFRKPIWENLGVKYEKIKVSAFRLSLSVLHVELRPSESDLARTIVVSIIPSADVMSPKLERKDKEYDNWGDRVMDKLQDKLHDKFQPSSPDRGGRRYGRKGSRTDGGPADPAPDPFRGSNVKIEEVGLGCSFHLVRVMPLVSAARRWGEYQAVRKSRAAAKNGKKDTKKSEGDVKRGTGDVDVEKGKERSAPKQLDTEKTTNADGTLGPERTWLRFVTFFVPAPHVRVRVKGVNIEVDKAYLAPEPPEGYLPSHQHKQSLSFFGDEALDDIFAEEEGTNINAALPEVIPAAIVPKSALKVESANGTAPKSFPTFADQDTMLRGLDSAATSEANSIIFHMERWVEHTTKKKGEKRSSILKTKLEQERAPTGASDDAKVKDNRGKPNKDKETEGRDDDTMNLLLRLVLRHILTSVEVDCADISLTIAGADAQTVQKAREENAVEPYRANMALSEIGWQQRALTLLSIQKVFISFNGPDCAVGVSVSGISMRVGMPSHRPSLLKRKYFPEAGADTEGRSPNNSPTRPSGAGGAEKKSRRRTWYTVVPPNNDVRVEVDGVLSVLVWALNYDHHWEERKLGIEVGISNLSLRLESLPLFTAFMHLDDFSDPNSSHGQWAAWLRKRHQLAVSPLSDDERLVYRKCYKKVQGIKEGPLKDKSKRGKLSSEQKPSYLKIQDRAESNNTTQQPGAQSPPESKNEKDDESEKSVLAALEKRMTCEEILRERCSVLGEKWRLSGSNPELLEFLRLTNSELMSKKRSPRSRTASSSAGAPQDKETDSSALMSPFERLYPSPVDALVSLVREKYHLLAPSVDISFSIEAIKLHFIDRSFGERRSRMHDSLKRTSISANINNAKFLGQMSTTLAIEGTALQIHQQSIVFSALPETARDAAGQKSLRRFQNISMTVDRAGWKADISTVGDIHLPSFLDGSPCGIVYKKFHDTPNPILTFALDHKKNNNRTADSQLQMKVSAGHFIFIVNPIPLASSLAVLISFADLPFRDLAAEKEAQDAAELENAADENASSRQLTQFSFSATQSTELVDNTPPKGIILGGSNISLIAHVSNISLVPLSDETGVNKGTLEITIEDIFVIAESSQNCGERANVSVSPFKAQECRLLYAPSEQGGFVKLFHLPFKPALDFGGASVTYCASLKEGAAEAMTPMSTSNADQEPHVFDIQLSAYVRRVAANISPTINASLIGALNCCNVIAANLPAPEKEEPHTSLETIGKDEGSRTEALKELWRLADTDGSGTLSVNEVTEIIARLFSAKSLNIYDELPKAQQLTDEELKREVRYFLELAGSNTSATRELSFPEVNGLLFQNGRIDEGGISGSEDAARDHDFDRSENLRGLIYYYDLLEYASSSQVFRLTGINDAQRFPPPSSWRQGQGIDLFWELYEKETGCWKSSLNGQKISDVQRKLVRVLRNYSFAKYCWKTLVKPALLQSQQKELMTLATPTKRAARTTTDWILDKNTKSKFRAGAIDMFASHIQTLKDDIEQSRVGPSGPRSNVLYDVKLLIEMDEASAKIGNGLAFATPLVDAIVSRTNLTASARLNPSSSDGIFALSRTEQDSQPGQTTQSLSDEGRNHVHFEFVVAVKALNTKHAKMEDFLEPFSAFGEASYALKESPAASGGDPEQADANDISCKIIFPKFISINISPCALELINKLDEIAKQSSPEVFEALALDLQIEGVRDLWSFLDKDTSEELGADDLVGVMQHFLGTDNDDRSNKQMDMLIDSVMKTLDADESGTIAFAEIEEQIRSDRIMFNPAHVHLHNHLGVSMRFCCRSFMDRILAKNPSISSTSLISSFDLIKHNGIRSVNADLSSVEATKRDGIILAVPGCKIIDVSLRVYQSVMVHLKSLKFARRSRRRSRRDEGQNASGFEPYITLVLTSPGLDSITITARSSLTVTAETPINIRVVKVSDLGVLQHGRKNRERDHTVNLAKKNLDYIFKQCIADAQIVFERNGLQQGTKVGLPINIMLSSSYHFLIIGDITQDGRQFWRDPVLLTRDFLFNPRHIGEVIRCHAASGIAIHRNRLNVNRSSRSRQAKKASKTRTAWDTSISVMPSFVLTNALPFNIQFRCWQAPPTSSDDWKAEVFAAGKTPPKNRRKVALKDEQSDEEELQSPDSRRYPRHRKTHSNALESVINQVRKAFVHFDDAATGANVLLNGINMKEKLYIQIAHDCSSTQDIDNLIWTAPLSLDLKRLRVGGNRSGSITLPVLKGTIGDDADFFLDVTVERSGIPYCSIFAPFWLSNKTGMKMMMAFTGRDDFMYDSGAGGLPIMAMCNVAEKKGSGEQREVSIVPVEGESLEVAHTWWDEPTNGQLVLNHAPLNSKGKSLVDWSDGVGLDAVGTLGECMCRNFVFGVSIETLTGAFYRTNNIAFTPRYVVKNCMHIPITILPVVGLLSDVEKLAKRMTQNGLDATLRKYKMRQDAFTMLHLDQSTIVYEFQDSAKHRADKDKDRFYLMRIDADTWNYLEQWHIVRSDMFGSNYFAERDGVRDSPSGIIKVDVQQQGPTRVTSVMISPRSPFQIENRSTSQYVQFVQDDHSATVIELPPMSFCSFSWDNPYGKKKIRAVSIPKHKSREYLTEQACKAASPTSKNDTGDTLDDSIFYASDDEDDDATSAALDTSTRDRLEEVKTVHAFNTTDSQFIKRKRLYSRRSKSYDPSKVGSHTPLPYPSPEQSSSVIQQTKKTELFTEVRILAGSRVLSFNDSKWRMHQSEIGVMRSGGYWKGIDVDLFALGATLSLVDDFPHEIMSMTLRHFSLYKHKGSIESTIRLRHIQIDSMFASAQYPVVLEPLPLGVDRRVNEDGELGLLMAKYDDSDEASPNDLFWIDATEWPMPFFEASISYLPQKHMTWIPALNIFLSPLKCQLELGYLLRIADLLINSLPEPDPAKVLNDTLDTLKSVNSQLEYPTRSKNDATLTYIEKFSILPTYVQTELDVKPEEEQGDGGSGDDEGMGGDDMLALSALGKQTSSNLSAGLLTWVNNVAAKFTHVSPKFKYDGMNRVDTYANIEDFISEVIQFYMYQTIYQSYKVVFSMQLFGDPQELVDHYKSGVSDLAGVATGKKNVGKGLSSASTNVFGGTLDFAGKITGEFSDLLDSLATNEYTSKDLKPKKSNKPEDAPGNIGEGVIEGTTFLGMTLMHGVAGVVGNPYRGLKKGSAKAVGKGVASGVGGLVVAPFVGALGFTAKVLEGTGNTTSLLEVSVIESRCRPVRIVQWGTSIGQVLLPYVKGIGIRVHSVRYQKRFKGPKVTAGSYEDEEDSKPQTAKEFKEAKAAEEKRKNPARKCVSLMRARDKNHILTTSRKPTLLEDEEEASSSPVVSKYVIVYEETLTLRCSDLQLSDVIAVYLWNYKSIITTSVRNKPLGICKFTVGDAFASMQHYYSEQINQKQVELSQHSTANTSRERARTTTSSSTSDPFVAAFGDRMGERKEKNEKAGQEMARGLAIATDTMLDHIARTRKEAENKDALTQSVGDIPTDAFLPSEENSWVMPAMQEYALMKPVPSKSRPFRRNIVSSIQEEMASIKRAEERAMAFFESETEEYSDSDSDFNMDDRAKIMDEDEEDVEKSIEHLHGHIMLSFFPIPW